MNPQIALDDFSHDRTLSVLVPMRGVTEGFSDWFGGLLRDVPEGTEVIVCDNASKPDDRIYSHLTPFLDRKPKLVTIRYQTQFEDTGATLNHLAGLDLARGKYVTWVGDDDNWSPDYFTKLTEFLEESPHYAAVAGDVRRFRDGGELDDSHHCEFAQDHAFDRLVAYLTLLNSRDKADQSSIPIPFVNMYRRDAMAPFRDFVSLFGSNLLIFDRLSGACPLLFGAFRTKPGPTYLKESDKWYGTTRQSAIEVWTSTYRKHDQDRLHVAYHHVIACAVMFLFARFIERRYPWIAPKDSRFCQVMYEIWLGTALVYFKNFVKVPDLSEEEISILSRYRIEHFFTGDPEAGTKLACELLSEIDSNLAPIMQHLFDELR